MKRYPKRGIILVSGLILILILFLPIRDFLTKADADNSSYTIRILEVTESGTTDLTELKSDTPGVQLETMSMKRFVSLRTDLDGKYDVIYIGKGKYNKSEVSGKNHNTTDVKNDITSLKVKQITEQYIDKGLYVFLNKDPFDNQQVNERGILYNSFNPYRSGNPKPNVTFVSTTEINQIIKEINNGTSSYLKSMKQRPRLEITNKKDIIDYTSNSEHVYKIGDELTYRFRVSNVEHLTTRPVTANLYISIDKSLKMTKDHLVASTTLDKTNTGELSYKLPKTYSGLLYWKLEIIDQLNPKELKDYDTGSIRFQGKKTTVNVLQVLPNNEGRSSSLKEAANMNQSFLSSDDYELNIETKSITKFNEYIAENFAANQKYGLNGTYDMIIFGFADIYNTKTPISSQAADAVVDFAEKTKQSVMFTHDTIYASTAEWKSKFQSITGQIEPETNLGLNAPNPSTTVAPVNDGLITQYPFNLSKTGDTSNKVATTHNQYFTLDLEDEEVIPWYNITGNSRDVNDSSNHYYTYSKGNVTYSGTGHIFAGNNTAVFPGWEQKLFVNTMYRAFTGANHAPEITVVAPTDNSVKPSYQENIVLSYSVDDWDLKDRNLFSSVKFKKDNVYSDDMAVPEKSIISGQTITHTFKNPFPDGGQLQIEISARDKQGAVSNKTINVTIKKSDMKLETTRSLSDNVINNEVKRDEEVVITYNIKPKSIPFEDVDNSDQGKDTLVISDIKYTETFPANLEITELPEGTTTTGTLAIGYTLNHGLGDIIYKLTEVNGVKLYVPQDRQLITFQVKGRPKVSGVYLLNNSKIDYEDIHLASSEGTGQKPGSDEDTTPKSSLGIAKDFSVFMLNDINISNFDIEGRMAGGKNVSIAGFGVGTILDSSYAERYTVIAGNNIKLGDGAFGPDKVDTGIAAYGGNATTPDYFKHKVVQDTPLDFDVLRRHLLETSEAISKLSATGETVISKEGVIMTLTGNDPKLNVFKVSGEYLKNISTFTIKAPKGSSVIVNIDGSTVEMGRGLSLEGVDSAHVLYNFYQASKVSNVGIEVLGTVLAPKATYKLQGNVIGTVIADSMIDGGYKIFLKPFEGEIGIDPILPEPPKPRPRVTALFPELVFKAVVKVAEIQLSDKTILVDTEHRLIPSVFPADADNKQLSWVSSNSGVVTVTQEGIIHGLKEGTAQITVSSTDGSGILAVVDITVINRNLTIKGPDTAKVNDEVDLEAIYVTVDERIHGYRWSVKPVDGLDVSDMVRITQDESDPGKVKVTALKKGTVTLVATVLTDKSPNGAMSGEHSITISQTLNEIFMDGPDQVLVGEQVKLKVITNPVGVEETGYQWSLVGEDASTYVKLDPASDGVTAIITGLKEKDRVQIRVYWPSDNLTATRDIKVIPVLTGLRLEDTTVKINGMENLFDRKLSVIPSFFNKDDLRGKLNWKSADQSIVSIDREGNIKGKKKGITTITVTYFYMINDKKVEIRTTATVKVEASYSEDKY